jgi:large subunit ribosomal protein L24
MSRTKTHVKKGDEVVVITGVHKGQSGTVLQVNPTKNQVLIEGVRIIKKHVKRNQDHPDGAIVEKEGPIHISNVKLVEKAEKETKAKKAKKGGK